MLDILTIALLGVALALLLPQPQDCRVVH